MVNSSHLKNFHLNYVTQQFSTTSQNKCLLSCNMKFCCIQHPSTPVNFKQFILSRIFTNTTRFLANKKVDDNALCKPFFICLLIALNQMVTRWSRGKKIEQLFWTLFAHRFPRYLSANYMLVSTPPLLCSFIPIKLFFSYSFWI